MSGGRLADAELKAIREANAVRLRCLGFWQSTHPFDPDWIPLLLAHTDALAADLAAAEGALHDLTSPQSGEANAAYLRGVEDATRRALGVLRERAKNLWAEADTHGHEDVDYFCAAVADALDDAARALESPPAPAAAPGGE